MKALAVDQHLAFVDKVVGFSNAYKFQLKSVRVVNLWTLITVGNKVKVSNFAVLCNPVLVSCEELSRDVPRLEFDKLMEILAEVANHIFIVREFLNTLFDIGFLLNVLCGSLDNIGEGLQLDGCGFAGIGLTLDVQVLQKVLLGVFNHAVEAGFAFAELAAVDSAVSLLIAAVAHTHFFTV